MNNTLIYGVFDFIPPSPMEDYIARSLVAAGVKFRREVEFDNCVNPVTGVCLRFDFVLFDYSVIVEYDGKEYHRDENVKDRDRIKNDFASKNGITLYRLQGTQHIEAFIFKLLPQLEIKKLDCKHRKPLWVVKMEARKARKLRNKEKNRKNHHKHN